MYVPAQWAVAGFYEHGNERWSSYTVVTMDNACKKFSYWIRAVLTFRPIYWVSSVVSVGMAPSTRRPGRCSLSMRYKGHNKRDRLPLPFPRRHCAPRRVELQHFTAQFFNGMYSVHRYSTCQACYHLACRPWLVLRSSDVPILDYERQNKKKCHPDNYNRRQTLFLASLTF